MELKIISICLIIDIGITLEGGDTPIAHCSVEGESLQFDRCFRPISVFATNHQISFIKLNLPILLMLVRLREKSQKHCDLLAFNWNLNQSNLCMLL